MFNTFVASLLFFVELYVLYHTQDSDTPQFLLKVSAVGFIINILG